MPSLSCLSRLEPGQIGSDSGTVEIPTAEVPFPISALGTFASAGVATVAFVGVGLFQGLFNEAGSSTVAFVGSSLAAGTFSAAGTGAAEFLDGSMVATNREAMIPGMFVNTSGSRQVMTQAGFINEE